MRIKPTIMVSLAISAFLFVSSIACLILQPKLEAIEADLGKLPFDQPSLDSHILSDFKSHFQKNCYHF